MPDPEPKFQLTKEQQQVATMWISARLKKCPICSSNKFNLNANLLEIRTFSLGEILAPGYTFPQVMVTCRECAHTMLFGAVESGILPKPEPKKEGEKDGN